MADLVITEEGRRALIKSLEHDGAKIRFTKLYIGDSKAIDPAKIVHKVKEIAIAACEATSSDRVRLHVTALFDDDEAEIEITEVGIVAQFANDPNTDIVLAIVNDGGKTLAVKTKTQDLILAYDIYLDNVPVTKIEVTRPGERLNLNLTSEMSQMAASIVTLTNIINGLERRITQLERK